MHLIITNDHISPLGFLLNLTPKRLHVYLTQESKSSKENSTLQSWSAVEAGRKSILPKITVKEVK